jgi:hypothetical protein
MKMLGKRQMFRSRFLLALGFTLAATASSSIWAQQYARPDGVQSTGTWTAINAASHEAAVNEVTVDNNDYIDSGAGNNTTIIFTLSDINDPGAGNYSSSHIIRYQCQATVGNKPRGGEGCNAELYLGNTLIAGTTNQTANRGAFGLVEYTITDASALQGANYANLELRITSSSLDTDESIQVSWAELEVPASAAGPPTLTASSLDALANVTSDTATLGGTIETDGGDTITERGIVWNTTSPPETGGTSVPMGSGLGTFSQPVSGLTDNGKLFYFRSYATNVNGTGYGPINSLYTEPNNNPDNANITFTNLGDTGFTINWPANPAGDGDGAIVVINTVVPSFAPGDETEYAASTTWANAGDQVVYQGSGVTSVAVDGLSPSTTYQVAVFYSSGSGTGPTGINYRQASPATNSQLTNTPAVAPTVSVAIPTGITSNSAVMGGNVSDNGGASVTDRGIVWNTTNVWDTGQPPASNGAAVSMGSGDGSFSQTVSGLPAVTTIYVRAYAINSAGTAYSAATEQFDTPAALATVATRAVENINATTADLGGNVTDDGGAAITERGIVWNTTNPPETGGTIVPMGSGTGPFIQTVTDLPTGVLVYFKAYATNSAGTAYSDAQSFTPAGLPTVTAAAATNITHRSATLGGEVTNNGGTTITGRGVVWNTTGGDPTIGIDNVEAMGSGTGPFSATVNDLPNGRTVYYRTYATNSAGTAYSTPTLSFPTLSEPTLQAANIVPVRISGQSLVFRWDRGNGDGSIVVVRQGPADISVKPADGGEYADNPDFTLGEEIGGNSGNIVVYQGPNSRVAVTGLQLNTEYSIAIYEYAGTGSFTDYIQLIPAEASFTTDTISVHNYDNGVECTDCHKHGSFGFLDGVEIKAKCVTCHNATGQASSKLEFDNHLTPGKNPGIDEVSCGMCHEMHFDAISIGNTTSTHPITLETRENKSFLRTDVDKYVPNAATPAVLHTDQPRRDAGNANQEPEATADNPDRAIEGGDASSARGYCQVCHTLTNYHRQTADASPLAQGDPQCHDGGFNDSCGENGIGGVPTNNPLHQVHCGECHEHNNKFAGVGGLTTCVNCHASETGSIPRPVITTQFDRLTSHVPDGSGIVAQEDCMVCHEQSTHNQPDDLNPDVQKIRVYDVDDGVTFWSQPTKAADPLASGEGEAFALHCLSCHDANGANGNLRPFTGGTRDVPEISSTSWSTAGHNRPVATSGSSPVSCMGDGNNGCHASGHGTESNFLLASYNDGVGDPATNAPVSPTMFCFNCHDGSPAVDIQAQFNTATNYQTIANSGATLNQKHDIGTAATGYTDGAISCADCHSVHVDNADNPVADPDDASPLPPYSTGGSYTDDGHNWAYDGGGNQDPVNPAGMVGGPYTQPDYIQFCLSCHDGTTPPGVTMPTMVNMALDSNGGGYPRDHHGPIEGNAGSKVGKGSMKKPYVTDAEFAAGDDPATPYAAMNCSDCHGAHGSPNIANLRSSITIGGVVMTVGGEPGTGVLNEAHYAGSSTYILPEISGGSQQDHYWGAWCTFCHRMEGHPGKVETDACTTGHMHGGGAF